MDIQRNKKVIAIYPGSFDPVTNGHLDLIARAAMIFDKVVVAVTRNPDKDALFEVKERVEMLEAVTFDWKNVEVDVFEGLLVDFARSRSAGVILRGIRAVSDYEYELQMAMMNRKLESQIETVFMLPAEAYSFVSSRLVKELARLRGPIKGFVPALVEQRLARQAEVDLHERTRRRDGTRHGTQNHGTENHRTEDRRRYPADRPGEPHRRVAHHGGAAGGGEV